MLSAPQTMGDLLPQSDVLNHTMIVAPTEWIEHIPTKNTKPGDKSPAIRCNVVDFAVDPHNPTIYRGVLWFGVISNSLKRQVGQLLAARMTQGTATNGNNPPWQLADVTGEAEWMAFMNNWLENTPAGKAFQVEAEQETALARQTPTSVATEAAPAPAAAAPPAPPAPVAAPPAVPPVTAPPAAPPAAPAPVAAAPVAAPAATQVPAGMEALLAAMPADQRAAALAILANQAQAAH